MSHTPTISAESGLVRPPPPLLFVSTRCSRPLSIDSNQLGIGGIPSIRSVSLRPVRETGRVGTGGGLPWQRDRWGSWVGGLVGGLWNGGWGMEDGE